MSDLVTQISKLKDLSLGSAKTYASVLRSMYKKLDIEGGVSTQSIVKNIKSIFKYAKEKPTKQRKQLLSAVLLFVDKNNAKIAFDIRELMSSATHDDFEQAKKQELTPNQKRAWLDWKSIISIRDKLASVSEPLWEKSNLSGSEFSTLQDYVIVCLYSYNAPRRAVDYCLMRKGEPRNQSENGIRKKGDKMYFIFNTFKTAKEYGSQTIQVDSELRHVLAKWMKVNPCQWLLVGDNCDHLSSASLTKRLGRIFNKPGFGINILRHAYVSDVALKNMPFLNELEETAKELGHSSMETILYKKKVPK